MTRALQSEWIPQGTYPVLKEGHKSVLEGPTSQHNNVGTLRIGVIFDETSHIQTTVDMWDLGVLEAGLGVWPIKRNRKSWARGHLIHSDWTLGHWKHNQQIRGTGRQSAPEIRTWAFQFLFSVSERCKDGFSAAFISLGRAGCINCLPLHNKLVHSLKAGNNKLLCHEFLRTGNSEVLSGGGSHPWLLGTVTFYVRGTQKHFLSLYDLLFFQKFLSYF